MLHKSSLCVEVVISSTKHEHIQHNMYGLRHACQTSELTSYFMHAYVYFYYLHDGPLSKTAVGITENR